ncbi:MAG TPA: valine--tRNA ligase [Gammaproteobacteria bacterium]|nr:valine--tRNA ligase [Gammaproteobacteria bacterium]
MLEKVYQPKSIEFKWAQYWEQNKFSTLSNKGTPYCIMMPPPNVTGRLHMGHGFQLTLMDTLIRFKRMKGFDAYWQAGTDHAGIATQMIVERKINQQGKKKSDLGRDAFLGEVWKWVDESGGHITSQMKRLGLSVDWECQRFTLDEELSKAVQEVFIKLYQEGLIYRGKKLVNWDTQLKTAVSDLEVVNEDHQGHLWYMNYTVHGSSESLTVATTRPETLFGDVAVAVSPDDERYQHLIGKQVQLPLTQRLIPVIADESVDTAFGTGCVKITPAHDFNDYDMGKRHQLELINILNPDGTLNDNVPQQFRDMDRLKARKIIVEELEKAHIIDKVETYQHTIPKGDRSGTVIEPLLTDQWFLNMDSMAEKALKAAESQRIKFHPENWINTYNQWLNNIQDWCISRQLWWGHRIPAWYDQDHHVYVGRSEAEIREKYTLSPTTELKQDMDVLDTWFSSALWPFSTLGWPEKTEKLQRFYPSQVMVTGFDIIFFWVARMIMMGEKFMEQEPFKDIYITGLIRDFQGHKMSKSKGNVLDPIDLIDGSTLDDLIHKRTAGMMQPDLAKKVEKATRKEFPEGIDASGTDALRFTFCALASTGRDIRFDYQRLIGYRNFCNKIWNAARFVMMQAESIETVSNEKEPNLVMQWMDSRLSYASEKIQEHLDNYRFDHAAQTLYDFIWNEFCDWYIEFAKPFLNHADPEWKATQVHHLIQTLDSLLRLAHPMIPYITEEIWQTIRPLTKANEKSIMQSSYPEPSTRNLTAENEINWIQEVITSIRTIRSEMNISPAIQIPLIAQTKSQEDIKQINHHHQLIKTLAKLTDINILDHENTLPPSASSFMGSLSLHIPLEGLIDAKEERRRIEKSIEKLNKSITSNQSRLNNSNFTSRAPQEVIEKTKQQITQDQSKCKRLHEHIKDLEKIS